MLKAPGATHLESLKDGGPFELLAGGVGRGLPAVAVASHHDALQTGVRGMKQPQEPSASLLPPLLKYPHITNDTDGAQWAQLSLPADCICWHLLALV